MIDGNLNEENGTELVLRIPLGKCGLERQFSSNPKGYFFRGSAILQFHPNFRTGTDKIWKILCFYRDHSSTEPGRGDSEIEWQLVRDHTQRNDRRPTQMPCSYRLLAAEHMEQMSRPPWGNNAATGAAECLTRTIPLILGQNVIHSWECNSDHFDVYQSFLINSCFLEPSKNDEMFIQQMLIDKNGCSTEPTLIETPQYVNQLKAFARGIAIRGIGNETTLRLRCSLKFCDRLMGECEEILPPKCGKDVEITTQLNTKEENNENNNTVISKRRRKQAGFPVLIRPLNGDGPPPTLVMFTKSSSKRRRPTQIDKRNFIVKDELIKNEKEKIVKSFETTVKTSLLENKKEIEKTTIETTTTKPLIITSTLSTTLSNELIKESSSNRQEKTTTATSLPLPPPLSIEEDPIIKINKQTKNENKKFNNFRRNEIISTEEVTGKSDPFQEENEIQNEGNLIKEEINLDPELLTGLNENEIIVISQKVEIR
ncbi:hypothetical protein ACQ4LE_002624, partial [Meloidogyne hapla]